MPVCGMKLPIACLFAGLMVSRLLAEDEATPVPPEVKALAEQVVAALKSGDDAALLACWHSPEILVKVKLIEEAAEDGAPLSAEDSAKESERELKRRVRDNTVTVARAAQLRTLLQKHFGDLNALTLETVEIEEDESLSPTMPAYDDVDLYLLGADGTRLRMGIDDLIQFEGAWKFKGRLEDNLSIELPEVE